MNFIKRIFREGSTSLIFVFGLAISCFILINIAELVETVQEQNDTLYSYSYHASGMLDGDVLFEQYYQQHDEIDSNEFEAFRTQLVDAVIKRLLNEKDGNTSISTLVSVNQKIDKYQVEIIMAVNEKLQLECESDYDYTKENGIIIGESLLEYVVEKDGMPTLIIGNIEMRVIGVQKNNMAAGVDNSIRIFWNNCDDDVKRYIREELKEDIYADLRFSYKSQSDVTESYQTFVSDMSEHGLNNTVYNTSYEGDAQNHWHTLYSSIFMSIGLIFSVFNCFSVSSLWLNRRKPELAIRKAYGYSIWQIAGVLLKDILLLNIPAGLVACLLQLMNTVVFGEYLAREMPIQSICVVCLGMMGVSMFVLVFMIRHVQKVSPVSILAEH